MKLKFADAIVPVKMLKIGTVVYHPHDLNVPVIEDSTPCHVVGFQKVGADIWIRLDRNGNVQAYDPSNIVYGID
jgi:hypothetical protein